jgi:ribosomal subunit interface protein
MHIDVSLLDLPLAVSPDGRAQSQEAALHHHPPKAADNALATHSGGLQKNRGHIMRYQISGKQIDIGEALTTHVKTELDETTGKYAGRPTDAQVIFSRNGHEFVCEITVHLSTGLNVQSRGHAPEIYPAFDSACEKMGKQLRRYKRRLKDHHTQRPQPVELLPAGSYILAPTEDNDDVEPDHQNPTIIAETEEKIPSLTVGEAVMQMELANAPVLVFRNEKHDRINVVYRREDGNIGWVDPRGAN